MKLNSKATLTVKNGTILFHFFYDLLVLYILDDSYAHMPFYNHNKTIVLDKFFKKFCLCCIVC